MKNIKKFRGIVEFKNKKYTDNRGYFKELYRENILKQKFPFLVMSYSKKNVIRGMHIQTRESQGKFISVLKGKIFDVSIDLRKKSKTFGKCYTTIISDKNSKSIYIPAGFAHGFQSLENENYVIYSCTKYRSKGNEVGIKYDDPYLNIKWPSKKVILSEKDKKNISFERFVKTFKK